MEKIPLRILGQARSDSAPEHYIVILEDGRDARRLPIIIGPFEAQAIAIGLEGIDTGRPMTHDLLKNTISAFHGKLEEVVIDSIDSGVFHAKLECIDAAQKAFTIDARSSDAIAMAVRFDCPIYTYQSVLDEAGIDAEDTEIIDEGEEPQPSAPPKPLKERSPQELKTLLDKALEREDYESAAKIRDVLQQKGSN